MSTTRTMTDEELMALPRDGFKRELVDGEIVMSPGGTLHAWTNVTLACCLGAHVKPHALGYLFDSNTGVRMPSGNLRVPDLTFVSRERMPEGLEEGFLRVVPDLVVEVLAPGDPQRLILDKVGEYLSAGVRLVWVVDPAARVAVVHRSLTDVRTIPTDGELDGADVLPGFRCRLADVLG